MPIFADDEHPAVVGIDPSLTATGFAWPDGRCIKHGVSGLTDHKVPVAERGPKLMDLVRRLRDIALGVDAIGNARRPGLVVMEELPPTPKFFDWERGYLWWALANALTVALIPVVIVPVSTIKKYATGKGNAAKAAVIEATVRRLPVFQTGGDDNLCDATWACAIGMELIGQPLTDMPKANRDALKLIQEQEAAGWWHHA
jgi:crossover junction endodeoxyribonuclease RuvC